MINICNRGCLAAAAFLISLFLSLNLFAFPDEEKAALNLVSSQASSFLLRDNQSLFLSFGDEILRVDLETWELTGDQVPALVDHSDDDGDDLTGDIAGMAIREDALFAAQADGDLLTVDFSAITEDPETADLIEGALGPMAVDPEAGTDDDKLYILDKATNALIVYDIGDETSSSLALTNSGGTSVAPVSIVLVPFPTDSSASQTDKIYITTNEGVVLVVNEGVLSIAARVVLSTTNKELPAAAVTPGGDFLLVVNATDTSVHVIDTETDSEADTDPDTSGTNPVSLPKNAGLKGVVAAAVAAPEDVYGFVTGTGGVSVVDLDIVGGTLARATAIDFNDEGTDDDEDDPLQLTSLPVMVVATTDGYVLTSNSNATISVISDNPFVTIGGTSLGSEKLTAEGSFTVTFQSDETGTYRVLAGGDLTGTGTGVASGTVEAVDTDVTTNSIAYDSSIFTEGTNRIFVFVADSEGNEGRDALDITVDTPPGAVPILSTGFGNAKIFITFERLDLPDMDHYSVFVDTDPDIVSTKTEAAGEIDQPSSGEVVEVKVEGLVNGTRYFVAVEAVDAAGNIGTRTTRLTDGTVVSATPERTVGLAESTGEAGCSLGDGWDGSPSGMLWLLTGWGLLAGVRWPRRFVLGIFFLLFPLNLHARELTPQWWSLEFKGGALMPLDGTTKDLLGSCCEPGGGIEFGFLYKSKFGFEVGVGYVGAGGTAVGASSGAVSRDDFSFSMIPVQSSFAFRADFKEDQLFVPYAKAGLDYLIYRENVQGSVTKGFKMGLHTAGGFQFLLDRVEGLSETMEKSMGVNDVYLTLEGRYAWINSFGGGGLDLSNLTFSGGFLFEF